MTDVTFNIAGDADDGMGHWENSPTWNPLTAPFFFGANDGTTCSVDVSQFGSRYSIYDSFMRWDTSSLAGVTITAAILRMEVLATADPSSILSVAGTWYDFGGEPTVEADMSEFSSGNAFAAVTVASMSVGSKDFTLLNLSNINQAGYTGIRIAPATGTAAPASETDHFVDFAASEHTTGVAPQLIVTYTAAASQLLAPSADSVDGTWTDQTGGTSLAAQIDETTASDTDYIRSVLSPSTSACRVKLATGGDPASSTGHKINWRAGKDTTGGQTIGITVRLYQGGGNSLGAGTLIASFTRSNVDALTDYSETLSGGEADSITNYGDLYLEFSANAT